MLTGSLRFLPPRLSSVDEESLMLRAVTTRRQPIPARSHFGLGSTPNTKRGDYTMIGVDVSKRELVVSDGSRIFKVANSGGAIKSFIAHFEPGTPLAMEATGAYHLELAD